MMQPSTTHQHQPALSVLQTPAKPDTQAALDHLSAAVWRALQRIAAYEAKDANGQQGGAK